MAFQARSWSNTDSNASDAKASSSAGASSDAGDTAYQVLLCRNAELERNLAALKTSFELEKGTIALWKPNFKESTEGWEQIVRDNREGKLEAQAQVAKLEEDKEQLKATVKRLRCERDNLRGAAKEAKQAKRMEGKIKEVDTESTGSLRETLEKTQSTLQLVMS